MSLIVPPPFRIATPMESQYLKSLCINMYVLPKNPVKARRVMRTGNVFARAGRISSKVKTVKQIKYSGFLPNVSLRGARTTGPIPSMTAEPVKQPITSFLTHLEIPQFALFREQTFCFPKRWGLPICQCILLVCPKTCDLIAMLASFFHFSQARGLDRSPFENSMS